jgi:hypothetical protein
MAAAPKSKKPRTASRPAAEGARKGAGRPLGSANKKTLEIANKAAEQGITPLEVMINVMRKHYAAEEFPEALDAAVKAAPYMHSKLSSVDLKTTIKKTAAEFTRDELLAIAAIARSGGAGSPEEGRRETESDSVH